MDINSFNQDFEKNFRHEINEFKRQFHKEHKNFDRKFEDFDRKFEAFDREFESLKSLKETKKKKLNIDVQLHITIEEEQIKSYSSSIVISWIDSLRLSIQECV